MAKGRVVVIGGGVGGLASALELRRHGFEVVLLERHAEVGGKASERTEAGFRWDQGPSIIVMPWVYRTLFEASRLDPDEYLPFRRLDPAFKVVLSDGRPLDVPADEAGLRDAFAAIEPADGEGLGRFLRRMDRFAARLGHAFCDRIVSNWSHVFLSPLLLSASVVSPAQTYESLINEYFRSPEIRELLYGFPTYSGFDPKSAPASLAVIAWTIIREGVWYPACGGVAEIPKAIARACRDRGVEIRTSVEVEAIERDPTGRVVGVATSAGAFAADAVVSNSDYVHTFRMLRGGGDFTPEVRGLRDGRAEPSQSFFTLELGCDRTWPEQGHHMLVLTKGSGRVYEELFGRSEFPTDPPLYVNVTSTTDPADAPPGGSNPFLVVGAPPLAEGSAPDPGFESRYAEALLETLERTALPGLRDSIVARAMAGQGSWVDRFHAFRGAIYGLGNSHNILGGSFRPLNYRDDIPGLYLAGGGVQPGAGLPMVVQSGKLVAERIARDRARHRIA